jgi:uncharacterized protein YbjT (DUF2867 family)
MKKIAIAGASGFIGQNLINSLLDAEDCHIMALARNIKKSNSPRLEWKKCDLFSVLDLEQGLAGADVVYYLVHSMQPSARLDQASFLDYDLMLADNLGRAAKKLGIKKVIYLSGIIPPGDHLSDHLASRLEVEQVLAQYFSTHIVLRSGLVLGAGGSSFHILYNLVRRLPILICPRWTQNQIAPVAASYVIKCLVKSLAIEQSSSFDLVASDRLTYFELLQLTADKLEKSRFFIKLPFSINWLSRLWVSLFSGASKRLVYPLIDSLSHSMLAREGLSFPNVAKLTVADALAGSIQEAKLISYTFENKVIHLPTVRSVQRVETPISFNSINLIQEYMKWLPRFLYPFVLVLIENDQIVKFCLLHKKIVLLVLRWSKDRSTVDRQIFYIDGGMLAAEQDRGRLEFRAVLQGKYALLAIHDFKPALPWFIYRYTQALVHLLVMRCFGRHLKKIKESLHES